MAKAKILVVDDEQEMLVNYQRILGKAGYTVKTAQSGRTALDVMESENSFSLIVCDLNMPEMDGMELVSEIKKAQAHLPVIMITGFGTLEKGIEAVKSGVFDFIEKPFSSRKLLSAVDNALEEFPPLQDDLSTDIGLGNLIGRSKQMQQVFQLIRKVANGNANVMITGESGCGKELVAHSLHNLSARRNQNFIPINCGAVPGQLFESELFGYEKGAFTGAYETKTGLVQLANKGTIFFDEICEMSPEFQVKMLRMLEERTVRRIGGKTEMPVDIRVLTATNRDVESCVKNGILREDLFFRINTINIQIPPLRERSDDIPLLVRYFLGQLNHKYQRQIHQIDPAAMDSLMNYDWPGNVRELQNVVERAYYLASPPVVHPGDLPPAIQAAEERTQRRNWYHLPYREAKEKVFESFEKDYLYYQLCKYDWNISRTADACEIDRRTIHRLINKFNLRQEDDR